MRPVDAQGVEEASRVLGGVGEPVTALDLVGQAVPAPGQGNHAELVAQVWRELCEDVGGASQSGQQEQGITDPGSTLADTAVRYLRVGQTSPDLQRLFIRLSLDHDLDEPLEPADDDLGLMRHRQEQGDLVAEIDPGFALLFMQAMVISSVVFPGDAQRLTGLDPTSPEFFDKAAEQLRIVVERLGQRRE